MLWSFIVPFIISIFNPQAPVAKKVADEVVFRRFQGEGVEFFFNQTSLAPIRFLMRIFWKIPILAHLDFIFQWIFISRSCFESDGFTAYSNEWDWREKNDAYSHSPAFNSVIFYEKEPIFCQISDELALIRIFCATGAWGLK